MASYLLDTNVRRHMLTHLRQTNVELTGQALTDPLTGIANRRALMLELNRILARYGGDEFVVVTGQDDSETLKQRLRELTTGRHESHTVTIDYRGASIGVVAAQPGETEAEKLLVRADVAMYEIKKARPVARL